jgi:hypothetical protein
VLPPRVPAQAVQKRADIVTDRVALVRHRKNQIFHRYHQTGARADTWSRGRAVLSVALTSHRDVWARGDASGSDALMAHWLVMHDRETAT